MGVGKAVQWADAYITSDQLLEYFGMRKSFG